MIAGSAATDAAPLIEESTADNWRSPLGSLQQAASATTDGRPAAIVALGKFDALHRGHRLLVEQAAGMGGAPWLISFSGMAQELGEPHFGILPAAMTPGDVSCMLRTTRCQPDNGGSDLVHNDDAGWQVRLPLVAPSERAVVLRSWAPFCSGRAPRMRCVPFGAVRQLSPQDFVAALAEDLRAAGVVVGLNYRFGFKVNFAADAMRNCTDLVVARRASIANRMQPSVLKLRI